MTEWRYNMHACVNIECFHCVFFSILEVSYSSQTCVNCTFTEQRFYRVQSTTRLVLKSPKVFYPRTKAVVYQTYVFELNRSSLPSMYGTLLRFNSHLWINWQTIIIQFPSWFWKYICNKMHYFTKYRDEYHAIQFLRRSYQYTVNRNELFKKLLNDSYRVQNNMQNGSQTGVRVVR